MNKYQLALILLISIVSSGCTIAHRSASESVKGQANVTVVVGGEVRKPGKYDLHSPFSIETALACAGGWSGNGEVGMAANYCILLRRVNGKGIPTRVKLAFDPVTNQWRPTERKWIDYRMKDGEALQLPEVIL